jgi:hypothetical protein
MELIFKKHVVTTVFVIVVCLVGFVPSVYAEKPTAVVHDTLEFTPPLRYWGADPESYIGPNLYYGKAVLLEYTITMTWTSITSPNAVRQILSYIGAVTVYDATGIDSTPPFPDPSTIPDRLIETRNYQGSLSFYDEGKDASDEMLDGLYTVDWESVYKGEMERLYHIEMIQGVHTRIVQVQNNVGTGKVIAFTNPPIIIVIDDISELS